MGISVVILMAAEVFTCNSFSFFQFSFGICCLQVVRLLLWFWWPGVKSQYFVWYRGFVEWFHCNILVNSQLVTDVWWSYFGGITWGYLLSLSFSLFAICFSCFCLFSLLVVKWFLNKLWGDMRCILLYYLPFSNFHCLSEIVIRLLSSTSTLVIRGSKA
jgi:hypothetical protein